MASADLREELNCSICLSIYTDPVTLSCGHNFCRVCIGRVLDTQQGSAAYRCPDCRAVFQERPAPQRNTTLCNIAERFLCTQPEQEDTGIFCTYCIHSPVPAVKFCLMCEASLCANHLRVHSKSEEHVLTEPITSLENRRCPIHKKVFMHYCTEDASCVCVTCCLAGEHRGHVVEPLNVAANKKNNKLQNILEKLISKAKETKERIKSLKKQRGDVSAKAAGVTKRISAWFEHVRRQLEALEKRVLSEISRQEEQVSGLIQQLEIQKDELSGKITRIKELCNMTDPVTVLQEQESNSDGFWDAVEADKENVRDLDERLISAILDTGLADFITGVKTGIYVQEASDLLLDLNTAGCNVQISDDLKTAYESETRQKYPNVPGRFVAFQVLSARRFSSGWHYWELETSELGNWSVGMCYPSIDRDGDQLFLGQNNKSWGLCRSNKKYSVIHDTRVIQLPTNISCQRFRIYLDYEAGRLSFYVLCDPITHLHTFMATFTEPLHAAFCVWGNGWLRFRK